MRILLAIALTATAWSGLGADEIEGRKVYEVRYQEEIPYGVASWSASAAVKTGTGKESRFLPYNSEAAKGLILDATTDRDVETDPALQGRETSFYMAYNSQGWYIYIHCQEPDIQAYLDQSRDVSLELFFAPGLKRTPYYQMIVRQFAGTVSHYDWGMPHRHYRSIKDAAKVESLPLKTGYATFIFIPWEILYDRIPTDGEYWRFGLMRWGPSMTWGGKVHDTGNFGLIHFEKPPADQREKFDRRILRSAWFKYQAAAKAATTFWSDEELGDLDFYHETLKPEIDRQTALGEALGDPNEWDAFDLKRGAPAIADWMEFKYKVGELRTEFLLQKRFADNP
ncbi:DOMON domain-containing protein [Lignipirellula cremea]|uniref:Uncharacterized protein n=1 Tax=Lignipirellula cremea TaxID=2528010 RepID=A0A518DYW7_9BACT|nr:hypothetical protein [Lignipirellula cremea]QDU96995.1 hypothetical protein Pla8534_48200 [Lignipirellula cremea]